MEEYQVTTADVSRCSASGCGFLLCQHHGMSLLRLMLAMVVHAMQAVSDFMSALPPAPWLTTQIRLLNRPTAPVLVTAFKRSKGSQNG
jgi:hypothetical protein